MADKNSGLLRTVPIHRALNRPNLVMGCDREMVQFAGLVSGTMVIYLMEWKAAVTAAWHYRCPDASNAPLTDREVWSERLNQAFRPLGTQWVVHVYSLLEWLHYCLTGLHQPIVRPDTPTDMVPSTTIWTGSEESPCPLYPVQSPALMHCVTSGQTPFRLNMHVRDLGHSIIFGPTGTGKSVLLGMLAAQFLRYPGMTVYAFDKGMSMYTLCKAVGGQHYDIAGDEQQIRHADGSIETVANYAFCPLQYLEDQSDVAWATQWIESLATLGGLEVKSEHTEAITQTLMSIESQLSDQEKAALENVKNNKYGLI